MLHHNCQLRMNNKTIANRIVVAPMASQTADNNGFVSDQTLKHYDRLSKSKAGIVMVEYSYVAESGKSEALQLGENDFSKIPGLSRLAKTIQRNGNLAILQIVHSGSKSSRALTGGKTHCPKSYPRSSQRSHHGNSR